MRRPWLSWPWLPALRWRSPGWRLLVLLALLGIWELYVDLGGADPLILPAPHAIAQSLYDDRSLLWSNFLVTAEEVLLGIVVAAVAGARAGDRDPLLADAAPGHLPAAGRLAGDPDPDHRAAAGAVAGVRDRAQAGGDRAGVVLLDRRHHARRARRGRPRAAQADAHASTRRAGGRSGTSSSRRRCRACSPAPRSPSRWR